MNESATGLNDLLKKTEAYKAWDDVLSYSQSHRADLMRTFAKGVPALEATSKGSRRSGPRLLQEGGGVPRVIRFILMLFIVLVLLETVYSTKKVYSGDAPYMNPMTQLFFMIGGTLNQVVDALGDSSPALLTRGVRFIWNIGKSTTNIPKNILPDLEIVPVNPIEERLSSLEGSRTSVAVGESKYRSKVSGLFGDVKVAKKELAVIEKKQEGFLERAQTAWGVLVGSSKAVAASAAPESEEPYSLENLNARMVAMQWKDTRIGRALNNTIYFDVAKFSEHLNTIRATDDSPATLSEPMEMIDAVGDRVLAIQEIRAQGPEFANRVKDWVQANLMTALYTRLSMNIEMEIALTSAEIQSTATVSQNTILNRNLYDRVKGDMKERGQEEMFKAFVDELKRRRLRPVETQAVAKKLTDHFIDIGHVEYATPEDIQKWVNLKSASRVDRAYNALLNALWRLAFLGIPLTYFMHRIGMFKGDKRDDTVSQAEMMRLFMALNNNMLQDREGGQRTITARKRSVSRSRARTQSIKLIEGAPGAET